MKRQNLHNTMAKRVTVKVPVRIDLAGGWTDVPAYCSLHVGEVVNVAINRYVTATCEVDDERKIEVTYRTETPTGCGLGTSGAMNVAFVAAISPEDMPPESIAEKAYQIEAVLGNTGGRQDQWASAFGGIQHLKFEQNNVIRTSLNPSVTLRKWLETNLMLFDTGIPHVSGNLHEAVWKDFTQSNPQTQEGLKKLQRAAHLMHQGILMEDRSKITDGFRMVMAGVDGLNPALHDPFRAVLQPLEHSGRVLAWKAMGAGGGGVVGALQRGGQGDSEAIIEAAKEAGWVHLQWAIENDGIRRENTLSHE